MIFLCCIVIIYIFFFFKQKTAYEMRISDWSSDVCSSDLSMTLTAADITAWNDELKDASPRQILEFALGKFDNYAISFSGAEDVEIGRASCRERVCQYV